MLVVILHPVSGVGLQEFVGGVLNLPHIVNVNRSIKLWCVEQIQLVYQLVLQFLQPDAGISGGATPSSTLLLPIPLPSSIIQWRTTVRASLKQALTKLSFSPPILRAGEPFL